MQWFRRGPEENPEDFWAETARRRGGEIRFFTFATLVGRSDLARPAIVFYNHALERK